MKRGRTRLWLLVLLPGLLLLPTSTASRVVGAQPATPTTSAAEDAATALAWTGCGDGAAGWECATLPVPLDYADPTGPTIDIAVTRLPAGDPARRIGALVFNCGGPGCPAVGFLHEVGTLLFPDEVRARFDLVGFDPRGVGQSAPLDCRIDWEAYLALDPSPDDVAEREAWLAGARDYAAACAANGGELLPFAGTENVVGDLERLRQALGEEQLSFLGLSYGTSIGARYADRHPDRVRAFALDSGLPSFVDPATLVAEWVDAVERSFDDFLADCAAALTCPFHSGGNPGAAFDALMTELDAQPLEVAAGGETRRVGQRAVLDAIDRALSRPTLWPDLAAALKSAAGGDGAAVLDLADQRNNRQPDGTYHSGAEVFVAVNCLDFPLSRNPADYEALQAKAAVIAPRLGAHLMTVALPCAFWPVASTPVPHAPVAHGAPPILVIGATVDSQSAYSWSVDMAGQLESGVLLRREGNGHPSYFASACVEEAINSYLLEQSVPAAGLVCPSTDGLFERVG